MATNPTTVTPSSAPTNKAVAATGASAFGAAVATLILYFFKDYNLPVEVQGAITTIVTAILTACAAYFVPPGSGEAVVVRPDGSATTGRIAPAA